MPARTNHAESNGYGAENSGHPSDRSMGVANNGHRWRFNHTGQLVDSEAPSSEWDLAQDIARLKIGAVGDLADDVHGQMRTPPQSKIAAAAVVQYNESSPLETASEASIDSSPHNSDHQISPSHSRVSSTDTLDSHESALSSASHTLRAPPQLKIATGTEAKERPHSFSGGLSAADLRRLQQAGEEPRSALQQGNPHHQWSSSHYRDMIGASDKPFSPDQPTYPSLANGGAVPRGQQQYDYRSAQAPQPSHADLQAAEYNLAQRGYFPGPGTPQHYAQGRPPNGMPAAAYRQPQRGFPAAPLMPSPTALGYPSGHVPHMSLATAQQLYDMVMPSHPENHHPAVARVQQQHNVFRATHQHSASDPSAMRDAATLALLNGQAFAPPGHGMYPTAMPPPGMNLYPNQFYGTPDGYDVAAAQAMVNRLQAQFTGPYGVMPTPGMPLDMSESGSQNGTGPSANNRKLGLYKTELCRSWEEKGSCRYGAKCQFAHGEEELRNVARHPKYKTEICRTFWVSGACPYGKRCCFIHTELPVSGIAPGADGVPPPPPSTGGRERSNSDPNESSISLLARIQRKNESPSNTYGNNISTPVDTSPSPGGFFSARPPTGSLRVDTSALTNIAKQNKSAYPTFASNALMLSQPEHQTVKSPVPLTAGPDLGRHTNARLDIVGYNQQRLNRTTATNPNVRHSFNGTEVDLDFTTPTTPSGPSQSSSFAVASTDRAPSSGAVPRGHVRSGSAGNWANVSRSSNLASAPSYTQSPGGGGEVTPNSSWLSSDFSSRLNENWI
ncbi:hypothetical protein BV22DRAFT_1134614 [Leucogyrophana mollusca]|uniref:Uncharacterized protein n=1 Tax=Leucogyrophana mollusca TaxID=85980 RepID=A0ACB8B136_9AGAM|nr:hypothetical protein BV22DRAFT_1134614 [Leucogyrophana mollusca]